MAVAFDAVGPAGGAGVSQIASGFTMTISHVVGAGSDMCLIVAAELPGTPAASPATCAYGGVGMTSLGTRQSNTGVDGYVQMWYLLAPATGTANAVVSWSGQAGTSGTPAEAGSVSYSGVASVGAAVTAFGASGSNTITIPSAVGDMTVAAFCAAVAYSGNNQTLRVRINVNTNSAGGNFQITDAAGSASNTHTGVANDWWGIIGVNLVAAGGGGGGATSLLVPPARRLLPILAR